MRRKRVFVTYLKKKQDGSKPTEGEKKTHWEHINGILVLTVGKLTIFFHSFFFNCIFYYIFFVSIKNEIIK